MPFEFAPTEIPGVTLVRRVIFGDERGSFAETYKRSDFEAAGIRATFVQDGHSRSVRRTVRGLHFQRPPRTQGKLVSVLAGEIFDVATDLRRGSPSFGRWVGAVLDGEGGWMLWIPPGFAHGFQVLSEVADIGYKLTEEYAPDLEGGIRWNDPDIMIDWPLPDGPIVAPRDRAFPLLRDAVVPFVYITPP